MNDYEKPAVLHERSWGRIVTGVQPGGGGPINEGTLAGMVKEAMGRSPSEWENLSISVSGVGNGWLEIKEIREIFERLDFPH